MLQNVINLAEYKASKTVAHQIQTTSAGTEGFTADQVEKILSDNQIISQCCDNCGWNGMTIELIAGGTQCPRCESTDLWDIGPSVEIELSTEEEIAEPVSAA